MNNLKFKSILKYIEFSKRNSDYDFKGFKYPGDDLAIKKWGEYTYMFPNIEYIDNVGEPLKISYENLELVYSGPVDVYKTNIMIENNEFEIFTENSDGFAVAYGPIEILKLLNKNK